MFPCGWDLPRSHGIILTLVDAYPAMAKTIDDARPAMQLIIVDAHPKLIKLALAKGTIQRISRIVNVNVFFNTDTHSR